MAVDFFFTDIENQIVQLPFVPEKIDLKIDGNLKTLETINLGEVTIPRMRKPIQISFSSFFPGSDYLPGIAVKGNLWEVKRYVKFFTALMWKRNPVRFTVTGFPDITIICVVKNFKYDWQGGSEDCNYTLELVEYRDTSVPTIPLISRYTKVEEKKPSPNNNLVKKVTPGCEVILNGRVFQDSYGNGPGKTFKDYHAKVNIVKTDGRSHPYHLTSLSGGWLGWVVKSSVTVV